MPSPDTVLTPLHAGAKIAMGASFLGQRGGSESDMAPDSGKARPGFGKSLEINPPFRNVALELTKIEFQV